MEREQSPAERDRALYSDDTEDDPGYRRNDNDHQTTNDGYNDRRNDDGYHDDHHTTNNGYNDGHQDDGYHNQNENERRNGEDGYYHDDTEYDRTYDSNERGNDVNNHNGSINNNNNNNERAYRDNDTDDEQKYDNDYYKEDDEDAPKNKTPAARVRRCCATCYRPSCDFRGPCKFPHGCCYSVMGILTAIGGLMMNLYVLGSCLFQRITPLNPVTGEPMAGEERGYGFLSRETDYGMQPDYRQCSWYTHDEYDAYFDGWMQFGRIFAFASAILASICFLVMFMTCCCAFSPSMFEKWLFWMYISAALTICFAFLIFGSEHCADNKCKVADGCGWAISAFMFHLLAANSVKSMSSPSPRPPPPPKHNKTSNPDAGDDEDNHDNNNEDEPDEDEIDELDDLYYENEDDKYPLPHPDGPRGVVVDKNGIKEYDDGEDYYNEMGRLIPDDDRGDYYQARKADNEDEDLNDISDHDLDDYASDEDDDDGKKDKAKTQYDQNGNPIYDPETIERTGNLGVGYEDDESQMRQEQYDAHGNRVQQYDAYGNPVYYNDDVDEFGNPVPNQRSVDAYDPNQPAQVDQFGNPIPPTNQRLDEYGNPIDEFGNPVPSQPLDELGNPIRSSQESLHPSQNLGATNVDEFGNPVVTSQRYDGMGNPIDENTTQHTPYQKPYDSDNQTNQWNANGTLGSDDPFGPNTNASTYPGGTVKTDDPSVYTASDAYDSRGAVPTYTVPPSSDAASYQTNGDTSQSTHRTTNGQHRPNTNKSNNFDDDSGPVFT